jgi:hypothetical protein
MNLSVTIPQVFYDLVARVIPGFAWLIVMQLYAPGAFATLMPTSAGDSRGVVPALGRGIGYAVACYLIGWILHGLTWGSMRKRTKSAKKKTGHNSENTAAKDRARTTKIKPSLSKKYQWIRLANPAAGFRIVKLRAEARMLETTRTALFLSAAPIIVLILVKVTSVDVLRTEVSIVRLSITLLLTLAAALVIWLKLERRAWANYRGNISSIYGVLHNEADPIPTSVPK